MRNAEFHRTRKRLCQRRAQTKKTNAPEGSASACRMKKKQGISIVIKRMPGTSRALSSSRELSSSRALKLWHTRRNRTKATLGDEKGQGPRDEQPERCTWKSYEIRLPVEH